MILRCIQLSGADTRRSRRGRERCYSGKGFADVVYLPKRNVNRPALVVELKWNKTADGAIRQIKRKEYASWIEKYTGDILLVGVNYKEEKIHECVIEKYAKED